MPYVTAGKENGANIDIYYKDRGKGQPDSFIITSSIKADTLRPGNNHSFSRKSCVPPLSHCATQKGAPNERHD